MCYVHVTQLVLISGCSIFPGPGRVYIAERENEMGEVAPYPGINHGLERELEMVLNLK